MKLLFRSLALRISIIIIIIEAVVMTAVGVIYYNRFSDEVDRRLTERMQTAGKLLGSNEINISSAVNRDIMEVLIGEEIIDSMLIDNNSEAGRTVRFSLNPDYLNLPVEDFTDVDTTWFDAESDGRIERTVFNGQDVLTGVFPVESDNYLFFLFRSDVHQADQEKRQLLIMFLGGSVATILATSLALFVGFNTSILLRIREMVTTTEQVEKGKLSVRIASADSSDEIGTLQRSINSMIARLENLVGTLEQRVADRTRELEIAADVSKQITVVLDIDELLAQVTTLTCRGFGLYSSTIFLLDEEQKSLHSAAGVVVNPNEEITRTESWTIALSAYPSIVAKAARNRAVELVNNIADSSSVHLKNPLFLGTQSEIAIPMLVGGRLIGVFDLKSKQVDRFKPTDVRALTSLAEQIAIAIQNAQLFTDVQTAREEAEQANSVKSQFLASMSHELRTPLNAILNLTRLVSEGVFGDVNTEQSDMLERVVESGRHLLGLINDVLDISKIESGSLQLFVEDNVDLKPEFQTIADIAKTLIDTKPVELVLDIDENLPSIVADKRRIYQIILNLVSNACKFTREGRITIRAVQEDSNIKLTVKDTGPGIAPEEHAAVFDIFSQTSVGLKQGGGTGLGMPISRRLAEAHEGKLWLESTSGQGATFYVVLPIRSEKMVQMLKDRKKD